MLAFFSISIFFLPFTENITHVIIFAVIFSSTYALIYPFISSLLVQPGNENSSGRLFGALNATFGIGVHLMTFVFGYVIQYFGYARGFQTCSLFILIFTMIILIKGRIKHGASLYENCPVLNTSISALLSHTFCQLNIATLSIS